MREASICPTLRNKEREAKHLPRRPRAVTTESPETAAAAVPVFATQDGAGTFLATCSGAGAAQAPGALSSPDVPISHHDRVYAAEQFSNTVSVTDPVDNKLLGVIRLGDPQPVNFSPLYKGQVLVHGMGYSPDHKTLAVVSTGAECGTFIDTATNAVKHTTYMGRSPHE